MKKTNWINERWIRWTNHEKIVGLRVKTYGYLKDNNYEDKKSKSNSVSCKNLTFKDYKRCLTASQIENKLNYLKKIDADCLNKDKKEFLKKTNIKNTTKII